MDAWNICRVAGSPSAQPLPSGLHPPQGTHTQWCTSVPKLVCFASKIIHKGHTHTQAHTQWHTQWHTHYSKNKKNKKLARWPDSLHQVCSRRNTCGLLCSRRNTSGLLCSRRNTSGLLCSRSNTSGLLWACLHSSLLHPSPTLGWIPDDPNPDPNPNPNPNPAPCVLGLSGGLHVWPTHWLWRQYQLMNYWSPQYCPCYLIHSHSLNG